MTEEKLLAGLAELRRRYSGSPPETQVHPHPDGLTFSRAWELAQDHTRATEAEIIHLDGCRQCSGLVQSAQRELVRQVTTQFCQGATATSLFDLVPFDPRATLRALCAARDDGWLGVVSRLGEPLTLQDLLRRRSSVFQNVTVFGSSEKAAEPLPQKEFDLGLEQRYEQFGYSGAPHHLVSLLSQLSRLPRESYVGVSWGRLVTAVVFGVNRICRKAPPCSGRPLKCVATVGEMVGELASRLESSSSKLAYLLAQSLHGKNQRLFQTLEGVPAFIAHADNRDQVRIMKKPILKSPRFEATFGDDTMPGVVDLLDAIITSCGPPELGPSRFWMSELARLGCSPETLARLIYGEIGSVMLPREGLSPEDQALLDDINLRWTGITFEHYQQCARKKPGVILLAVGRHKAAIVLKCIEFGLVTELIIDGDLEEALWDLVDPEQKHHQRQAQPPVAVPVTL